LILTEEENKSNAPKILNDKRKLQAPKTNNSAQVDDKKAAVFTNADDPWRNTTNVDAIKPF